MRVIVRMTRVVVYAVLVAVLVGNVTVVDWVVVPVNTVVVGGLGWTVVVTVVVAVSVSVVVPPSTVVVEMTGDGVVVVVRGPSPFAEAGSCRLLSTSRTMNRCGDDETRGHVLSVLHGAGTVVTVRVKVQAYRVSARVLVSVDVVVMGDGVTVDYRSCQTRRL